MEHIPFMKNKRRQRSHCHPFTAILLVAGGLTLSAAPPPLPAQPRPLLPLPKVEEPSGLCFHPGRGTLFVVDDGGVVAEFRPGGEVVNRRKVRKADFEGITCDPSSGLLYVAVEGEEVLLELDPATLEARREFALPRELDGRLVLKPGGQGIEAITFVPDTKHPHGGTFFVANQGPDLNDAEDGPVILEVEVPLAAAGGKGPRLLRDLRPGLTDLAALHYDARMDVLLVVSDALDRMLVLRRDGTPAGEWQLPGENQEGLTIDAAGLLYLAQDSGGVAPYAVDWARVLPAR